MFPRGLRLGIIPIAAAFSPLKSPALFSNSALISGWEVNLSQLVWFISANSKISGPFSTDQVVKKIANEELSAESYVWWRGQSDWKPISEWNRQVDDIVSSSAAQAKKRVWHIDFGKTQVGPLTQAEMIANLKKVNDFVHVKVWVQGTEDKKKNLFEMHDIMELLGIDLREFERVPLSAQAIIKRRIGSHVELNLKTSGISKGGIGVSGDHDLVKGEEVEITIDGRALGSKLYVVGEVVYVNDKKIAGIRFVKPSAEAQSVIFDYVKQFNINQFNLNQSMTRAA